MSGGLFDQFIIVSAAESAAHLVGFIGIESGDIDGQLVHLVLKQDDPSVRSSARFSSRWS